MTDNELIAEFMGKPMTYIHDSGNVVAERKMNYEGYYTEWNNLMPVVEKIGDLYLDFPGPVSDVNRLPIGSHIQQVYKAVIEFIKWYNSK